MPPEEDELSSFDTGRRTIEAELRKPIQVDRFPGETAGACMPSSSLPKGSTVGYDIYGKLDQNKVTPNIYAPFTSELDWKVARWAKTRGPGSTAVSELLSIPSVSHSIARFNRAVNKTGIVQGNETSIQLEVCLKCQV